MFCFCPDAVLRDIVSYALESYTRVREAVAAAGEDFGTPVVGDAFRRALKIGFDHAVMDKTACAASLPTEFPWCDVGGWKEAWRLAPKDTSGAALIGPAIATDVTDIYFRSEDQSICTIGVDGLAVVDSADAVLVAPIARSHEVKALVAWLDAEGRSEARTPLSVHRPWGSYQTLYRGDRLQIKRIHVAAQKHLSFQNHHQRAEHWIIVRGPAEFTRDADVAILHANEFSLLPTGTLHCSANPVVNPLDIVSMKMAFS